MAWLRITSLRARIASAGADRAGQRAGLAGARPRERRRPEQRHPGLLQLPERGAVRQRREQREAGGLAPTGLLIAALNVRWWQSAEGEATPRAWSGCDEAACGGRDRRAVGRVVLPLHGRQPHCRRLHRRRRCHSAAHRRDDLGCHGGGDLRRCPLEGHRHRGGTRA